MISWGDPISKAYTGVGVWRYDVEAVGLANVGTSIALDVLVLCLPLPVISTLHLRTRKKVAISLVFWLGILYVISNSKLITTYLYLLSVNSCCISAIVRLVMLHRILHEVIDFAGNIGRYFSNQHYRCHHPDLHIRYPIYAVLFSYNRAACLYNRGLLAMLRPTPRWSPGPRIDHTQHSLSLFTFEQRQHTTGWKQGPLCDTSATTQQSRNRATGTPWEMG